MNYFITNLTTSPMCLQWRLRNGMINSHILQPRELCSKVYVDDADSESFLKQLKIMTDCDIPKIKIGKATEKEVVKDVEKNREEDRKVRRGRKPLDEKPFSKLKDMGVIDNVEIIEEGKKGV